MLTNSILRQLATETSYDRGESYYHDGSVRRLNRDGNTFIAKVRGSENYEVSLTLKTAGPEFSCSCPYAYEGICKHAVALGLAALSEFGPTLQPSQPNVSSGTTAPLASAETLWQVATTDQKLNFLRQLLDKQSDLREQLTQFIGFRRETTAPIAASGPSASTEIDKLSTEVYEALSDLVFDEESMVNDGYHYTYYDDGLDPDPLIKEVLKPYADQFNRALREGRLMDALVVYLGVYEGAQAAMEAQDDEFDVVQDYPELSWRIWNELVADAYAQLATRVLHPDQIRQSMQLLADRVTLFDQPEGAEAKAEEDDEEWDDDEDNYEDEDGVFSYASLRNLEPLLMALVTDAPSARAVQEAIEEHKWTLRGTEYIQLRIADTLEDSAAWLRVADKFADWDSKIAQQLLERRLQLGDVSALLRELHRLTKQFPNQFNAFVVQHIDDKKLTPGPDLDLFLTSIEAHCRSQGKLSDYLRLRDYWTDEQRRKFADSLNPKSQYMSQPGFYAQVLHTENRSDDLLAWVKAINWDHSYHLVTTLPLLAETHPADCMQLVAQKSIDLLETGKRDRKLYNTIAGWLAALNMLPTTKPAVTVLVSRLLGNYSRLSALRDEFKMKNLTK